MSYLISSFREYIEEFKLRVQERRRSLVAKQPGCSERRVRAAHAGEAPRAADSERRRERRMREDMVQRRAGA